MLSNVHLGKTRLRKEPRRKLAINNLDNTVQVGMKISARYGAGGKCSVKGKFSTLVMEPSDGPKREPRKRSL